jgi:hypothetical protein
MAFFSSEAAALAVATRAFMYCSTGLNLVFGRHRLPLSLCRNVAKPDK